jgi:antitoxin MazE
MAEDAEDLAAFRERVNEPLVSYDNLMKRVKIKSSAQQGVTITRQVLDKANLGDEVDIEVNNGEIKVRAAKKARQGWDEQFKLMAARGDDRLLDADVIDAEWDEKEWQW